IGAARVKIVLVHILVVHAEQAVAIGVLGHGEVVHAIVVRPHLLLLLGAAVAGIRPIVGVAAGEGVAPGDQRWNPEAVGHGGGVGAGGRHGGRGQQRVEGERGVGARGRWQKLWSLGVGQLGHRGGGKRRGHGGGQAARQHLAAGQALGEDGREVGVVGGVAVGFVGGVEQGGIGNLVVHWRPLQRWWNGGWWRLELSGLR